MPHLSPMSWTLTMMSLWLIILSMTASKFSQNLPLFHAGAISKSLNQDATWVWSLQGGRE